MWGHFQRKLVGRVYKDVCNYCSVQYLPGGTGNMRTHIQNKHADKLRPEKQRVLTNNLGLAVQSNQKVNFIVIVHLCSYSILISVLFLIYFKAVCVREWSLTKLISGVHHLKFSLFQLDR